MAVSSQFFYDVLARGLQLTHLVRPLKASLEHQKTVDKRYEESDKWTNFQDSSSSCEVLAQLQQEQVVRTSGPLAEIDNKLFELRKFIRDQRQRIEDKEKKELLAKHWRGVALILDRIFFINYLIIITGSLGYILPVLASSANGYESTFLEIAKKKT